jgi:hypothetical protein
MPTAADVCDCTDLRQLRYGAAWAFPRNRVWADLWAGPAAGGGGAKNLLVFVPGYRKTPASYASLLESLMKEPAAPFNNADVLAITYRNHLTSNADPTEVARRISAAIQTCVDSGRYSCVYLLGHSLGGLLLRRSVIEGGGPPAPGEEPRGRQRWTAMIGRMVLLASGNRGFYLNKIRYRVAYSLVTPLFITGFAGLARKVVRESPWINNLRLGWIRVFKDGARIEIIQLRGDVDEFVGADDSRDLYRFGAYEVVIPGLRHADFVNLPGGNRSAYQQVVSAFSGPFAGQPQVQKPAQASNLVFLVHGIRDFADWQENLSYEINRVDRAARIVSVRYGYFSLLQFLLSSQRERCVRSFADFYIQEYAKVSLIPPCDKSPNRGRVIVAAHSNGTYALAHALHAYPDIQVDRAYLAGSVLPRRFRWHDLAGQVKELRNDRANWDWPVGCLCNGLRFIPWLWGKIGAGGYRGFIPPPPRTAAGDKVKIQDNHYLEGDHGVAFQPQYHEDLARYLITGRPAELNSASGSKPAMVALQTRGRHEPDARNADRLSHLDRGNGACALALATDLTCPAAFGGPAACRVIRPSPAAKCPVRDPPRTARPLTACPGHRFALIPIAAAAPGTPSRRGPRSWRERSRRRSRRTCPGSFHDAPARRATT